MNRSAAMARNVAQFMVDNSLDPLTITETEYTATNPPYTAMRLKLYFLSFRRAMLHTARHVERIRAITPLQAKKKIPLVRKSVTPAAKTDE